ncbi:hypothetical protein FIT69_04220 [Candidatus Methylopumilus planktonicus]|jgi:NDP-sugar pyrophosphorylase family protein|uniref:glycosyltransferase family 2 protein n=1 Tax=Candidatus Methylopumilus planktonicus TaxID=1581557 RepID=UPI001123AF2D|nr:glycosyltransferase family 2 protein [Candidatus Methylopumilus planktonicus]QDD01778.1 hypothetical protein FIT69_04220 [Candidatus Methylopumilus planktonicus]
MFQNIIITMAGKGTRFIDAGYNQPKYMIKAHNKTLFRWSLESLRNFFRGNFKLIFVTLKEHDVKKFIELECLNLGLKEIYIYELDLATDGQATSAYNSHPLWHINEPLLIYNIDTYVNPRSLSSSKIRLNSDGWIPCFKANGNHWSFVSLNQDSWAENVSEKNRISEHASIGLYWFKNAEDYLIAYEDFFLRHINEINSEKYIAPLYNHFIANKKKISVSNILYNDVYPLGTPIELVQFMSKDYTEITAS